MPADHVGVAGYTAPLPHGPQVPLRASGSLRVPCPLQPHQPGASRTLFLSQSPKGEPRFSRPLRECHFVLSSPVHDKPPQCRGRLRGQHPTFSWEPSALVSVEGRSASLELGTTQPPLSIGIAVSTVATTSATMATVTAVTSIIPGRHKVAFMAAFSRPGNRPLRGEVTFPSSSERPQPGFPAQGSPADPVPGWGSTLRLGVRFSRHRCAGPPG